MNLLPSQFDTLSKLLDVSSLRHQVVTQNIANVNTPGYKRLQVDFEDELAQQLGKKAGNADVSKLRPSVSVDNTGAFRADGNNVEIDREVGLLNKNMLLHNTYIQVINQRLSQMKIAVQSR